VRLWKIKGGKKKNMKQEKQEKINGNKKESKEEESKDAKVIIFVGLQQEREQYYEEFSYKTKIKSWL
jgi:hypothetical protein